MSDETQPQQQQKTPIPLTILQQDPSIIKEIISPNKTVERIIHSLRGEYYDVDKDVFVKVGEAMMNEHGINKVRNMLEDFITGPVFLSNLDEKMVNVLMVDISFSFIEAFFLSYEEYAIKEEDLNMIKNMVTVPIYLSLRRAVKEGERVFLTKSMFESRSVASNPMGMGERKKPWWKPW